MNWQFLSLPFTRDDSWFRERSRRRGFCDICHSTGKVERLREEQSTSKTGSTSAVWVAVHLHAKPPPALLRQTCSCISSAEDVNPAVTSAISRISILKSKLLRHTRLTNLPLHFSFKIVVWIWSRDILIHMGTGIGVASLRTRDSIPKRIKSFISSLNRVDTVCDLTLLSVQ